MQSNLTEEQAIALAKTGWWKGLTPKEIVTFQLFEDKLCMNFRDFHKAVQEVLGRPVYTHEFAYQEMLQKEFLGELEPPTFQQILELIPKEKRIVIGV